MPSAPWMDIKRELHEQEERFFERAAARVLRIKYPRLTQTPARQALDRAGIDLISRSQGGGIDIAVQCKGFAVEDLGRDQIGQSVESIDCFLHSNETCKFFIFIHNRDGRSKEFAAAIESRLAALVGAGKCAAAELWNLDRLLNVCKEALRKRLDKSLRSAAKRKLADLRSIFEVAGAPLKRVPADEKRLFLPPVGPARIEPVASMTSRNVKDLLRSRSSDKFTLLVGDFGTGKSTAGLLAATSGREAEPTIIFAECAYFSIDRLGSGLSPLLEEVLKAADAFAELTFRDQELLHLAAPLLRAKLSGGGKRPGEPRYVLLLDGLDENRLYARPEGMGVLINSLADIHCPIILTTRREHLISTFENFKLGKVVIGEKGGSRKPIRLFSLGAWTRKEIMQFVLGGAKQLAKDGKIVEARRVRKFLQLLSEEKEAKFYGDLAAHPLFLRLILDDVASNGVRKVGRAKLLWEWSVYKVERDIQKKTQSLGQGWTFQPGFVGRVMEFMEQVAARMTIEANGNLALLETVRDTEIAQLASRHFPEDTQAVITILLNSLLIPHAMLENHRYSVRFVYRAFHEFFLACNAVRHGLEPVVPGTEVSDFISELKVENFAWLVRPPERIL